MWKKSSAFYKPGPVFLDDRKLLHKLFFRHNRPQSEGEEYPRKLPTPSSPPWSPQKKQKQKYNGPPLKSVRETGLNLLTMKFSWNRPDKARYFIPRHTWQHCKHQKAGQLQIYRYKHINVCTSSSIKRWVTTINNLANS